MAEETLYVVARAVARPEEISRVREEFEALVEPTRAEPGCLRYELLVNHEDPGEFLFLQEYRDDDAFEAHLGSDHIARMLPEVLPRLASPPDIRRYRSCWRPRR